MIRIRFFGPRELNQKVFLASQPSASLQTLSLCSCPPRLSQGSLLPLFRCFRVTKSLTPRSKITGCPGWPLTICVHLSGRPTCGAFQRSLLSQPCGGTTGENALTSFVTSLPPLISRPIVHSFRFSSWILLTGGLRGNTTTSPGASPTPHRRFTQGGESSKLLLNSIAP